MLESIIFMKQVAMWLDGGKPGAWCMFIGAV